MRVVVMRCWLALAVLIGLPSVASSQIDYVFTVRVKLENIAPEVDRFLLNCWLCKFATPTTGGCVLPAATSTTVTFATGATQLGGAATPVNLPASTTPGGPKAYDGTVSLSFALTGGIRSNVTNFSCSIALMKPDGTQAFLLSSPQDLPFWARPDLNKPFTAIISGGL